MLGEGVQIGNRVLGWRKAKTRTTADPSLTTPRLKKAPGAPFAQDDTAWVGKEGVGS
jgi:hypothetical protein